MKKILIIASVVIIAAIAFLLTRVNREDLSYKSKYSFINTSTLKNNKGPYVLYIFNTNCPGTEQEFPALKAQLERLKKNNIPYFLIADEIYNHNVDDYLDEVVKKYNLEGEKIYLFDINEFPVNGGFFNSAKRYKDFMFKVTKKNDIPAGYVNHLIMNDGKLLSFSPVMEFDKLPYKIK